MEKSFSGRRKNICRSLVVGIESPEINHTYLISWFSTRVPKKQFFQHTVLEQLDIYVHKNEIDPYLTPCVKINSKWITDLHFRVKIIKLLEEYTGINLSDVELGIDFFDVTLKAQVTKEKSWTSSKLKTLVLQRIASRKQSDNPRNGRKY